MHMAHMHATGLSYFNYAHENNKFSLYPLCIMTVLLEYTYTIAIDHFSLYYSDTSYFSY